MMTNAMTIGRVFGITVCLLTICQHLHAATWYQLELILFRYQVPLGVDGEKWIGNAGDPDVADVLNLIEDVPEFEDEPRLEPAPIVENPQPMAFLRLAPDEQRLNQIEQRLTGSTNIEVLAHMAWRQPSFGNAGARTIYVSSAVQPDPAADGIQPVRSPLGRLEFAPPYEIYGTVRFRRAGHSHLDADFVLKGEGPPVRLTETRQMRLWEVHYFDHPLFGVLAQITPYVFSSGREDEPEAVPDEEMDDSDMPPEL